METRQLHICSELAVNSDLTTFQPRRELRSLPFHHHADESFPFKVTLRQKIKKKRTLTSLSKIVEAKTCTADIQGSDQL